MLKKIILASLLAFTSFSTLAESIYAEEIPLIWSSIITLSGGPAWATAGQNQYLFPIPLPSPQYYRNTSDTSTMASGELFFGLQRIVYPNTIGQLGLGVAGVTDAKVTGLVDVEGISNVYSYSYKVNHVRLELKGKLIATNFQQFQPYLSGSFGAGFNNSHEYIPVANYPAVYTEYWLQSNTTLAFSYSLGAGVQTMISPNWQVGVGYQFADLGKSFLNGSEAALVLEKSLRLTHLYTNEVVVSLSYVFS